MSALSGLLSVGIISLVLFGFINTGQDDHVVKSQIMPKQKQISTQISTQMQMPTKTRYVDKILVINVSGGIAGYVLKCSFLSDKTFILDDKGDITKGVIDDDMYQNVKAVTTYLNNLSKSIDLAQNDVVNDAMYFTIKSGTTYEHIVYSDRKALSRFVRNDRLNKQIDHVINFVLDQV